MCGRVQSCAVHLWQLCLCMSLAASHVANPRWAGRLAKMCHAAKHVFICALVAVLHCEPLPLHTGSGCSCWQYVLRSTRLTLYREMHNNMLFRGNDHCCQMPETVNLSVNSWRQDICLLRLQAHHWLPRMATGLAYCKLAELINCLCLPLPSWLCRPCQVVGTFPSQVYWMPAVASGMSRHAHWMQTPATCL